MKTLLTILLFLAIGVADVVSQEKETIDLTIEVIVTKYNQGHILLALYNNENQFMKNSYKASKKKIEDGKITITFTGIKKGDYAFSLFHDKNNNDKLDTNFLGIPKEPYLFSNNQKGRFGPPKFSDAKLEINKSQTITLKIK